MNLNTAVIYGSVRGERRQGIKAARFLVSKLEERGHAVTLVDPLEYELPLLDLMYKEFEQGQAPEAMEKVGQILRNSDGFIVVSAEYNHGALVLESATEIQSDQVGVTREFLTVEHAFHIFECILQ